MAHVISYKKKFYPDGMAGGGGGSVKYGEAEPTTGSDGELYFKTLNSISTARYFKLEIYKNRGNTNVTQLSKIDITDANGTIYSWSNNATATSNITPASASESADKLIDGSTNTKLCVNNFTPSSESPLIVTIDASENIDFSVYNKWDWYTANDASERDPITYTLYASQNGTNWEEIDTVVDEIPTSARQVKAYTGDMKVGTKVLKKYINAYGQWLEY